MINYKYKYVKYKIKYLKFKGGMNDEEKSYPECINEYILETIKKYIEQVRQKFIEKQQDNWPEGMCDTVVSTIMLDEKMKDILEPAYAIIGVPFHVFLKVKDCNFYIDPTANQFFEISDMLLGTKDEFEERGYKFKEADDIAFGHFTYKSLFNSCMINIKNWLR